MEGNRAGQQSFPRHDALTACAPLLEVRDLQVIARRGGIHRGAPSHPPHDPAAMRRPFRAFARTTTSQYSASTARALAAAVERPFARAQWIACQESERTPS